MTQLPVIDKLITLDVVLDEPDVPQVTGGADPGDAAPRGGLRRGV